MRTVLTLIKKNENCLKIKIVNDAKQNKKTPQKPPKQTNKIQNENLINII